MGSGDQPLLETQIGVGCILSLRTFISGRSTTEPQCRSPVCQQSPYTQQICGLTEDSDIHPVVLKWDSIQKEGGKSEVEVTFAKVRNSIFLFSQLILTALQIGSWHDMKSDSRLEYMQHRNRNKFRLVYTDPEDDLAARYPNLDLKFSLEEGKKMLYTSWVLCPHYHTRPLAVFQNFMGKAGARLYDYRLDKSSYVRLMEDLGLHPQEFTPTEVLRA
jgi:hypothetical protein